MQTCQWDYRDNLENTPTCIWPLCTRKRGPVEKWKASSINGVGTSG